MAGFDLFGEFAELAALGFGQVGGVRFFEEQEQVKEVLIRKIQVDDARASAFSPSGQSDPSFT